MDLAFNAEELAFQKEVRDWIAANMPPEVAEESRRSRSSHVSRERLLQWQKKLAGKGWLCPNWPREYGGPGWSSTQKFIFEMEMARADSPYLSSFSIKMVAPVLMKFGSEAQKKRFLPRIAAAEELWCQGYSEPGSGSDLASLRTRAVRDGDHYVVNGQKIWTTNAHWADWIFCLVRTSTEGKRQEGISFLLIDMKSPGIRIDPIYLVDGTRTPMRHEVNQVFFTDVKVPVENLVGEENKGWTYAKYLLEFERGGQAFGPRLRKAFRHLQTLSRTQLDDGEPIAANPEWREKMAALEIEIDAVEMNELMFYSSLETGDAPGNMGSVVKMRGTEVGQKVTELAVEAVGWYGVPFTELRNYDSNVVPVGGDYVDDVAPRYFNNRKTTIYGGSSEVQRNVLAKAMLGL
ncbi:acyl-CoA dehydrogenase family protein [Enhydrobacter sp.]|jgi:alkylation response protein AidB-like acyl-CoA dehydrogenase|uniref:acyl-CoA dehydrogenase family protein n=1 Tax=Enhydrobacter sp. TaxID=1894999 RepID=UPI0026323B37|nr:acyl-CoA dehydrogenase family protein [Enhydrobacter sp.]WIM13950.1 MAG: Acyl-CoA dehydrogenase, long-chain specific [Enhydrobacter sp.]